MNKELVLFESQKSVVCSCRRQDVKVFTVARTLLFSIFFLNISSFGYAYLLVTTDLYSYPYPFRCIADVIDFNLSNIY